MRSSDVRRTEPARVGKAEDGRAPDRELTRKWNAVSDTPGQAGANGYIAGQKVLDKLIAAVQAYGKPKGW